MTIVVYSILLLISLYQPKSKYAFSLIILFMWTISTFCYGIADEEIYISRYTQANLWSGATEFGFGLLIAICNKLGLNYIGFKGLISALELLLISSTIWKFAKYPNLVMLFYFLCPFPLNVAQIRNALATSIMIYGFKYLLEEDKRHRRIVKLELNDLRYVLCIMIATLVHTASIVWLLLLIAKKFNTKFNILFMILFNITVYFIITPQFLSRIAYLFGAGPRISAYLSPAYQTSAWRHTGPIIYVLFVALVTITTCLYIQRKHIYPGNMSNDKHINLCLRINIVVLCIASILLRYTSEITRIQEGLAVINYMLLTNAIDKKTFKWKRLSKSNLIIFGMVFVYLIIYMWLIIIHYLTETIWQPFWFNSYFWGS